MVKRYYPEKFNTITNADNTAMILDIERIPGESLFEYKKRVLETSSKVSNSSYIGLVNGINRELGLKQNEIIKIGLKPILNGDLFDANTIHTDFIISDNRLYEGIVDGTLTKFTLNKLTSHEHLWTDNYLVGLSLIIDGDEYLIISNTYNTIVLDREVSSLYINSSYAIRANWKANIYIGFSLILEKDRYVVLGNTSNTITVNKPINFREDGFFSLALARPRVQITSSRIIFYIEYLNNDNFRTELSIDLREKNITHRELCKKVNTESKYFQLEDLIPLEGEIKAFTFKHKDSDIKVFQESIPASKFFKLQNKNIKPDTLKFSESNVFSKEEETLDTDLNGPYFMVNHVEGIVRSTYLPSGEGQASYVYMDFPFIVESTPAVIVGLSDKESQQFLFSQKEKILYEDSRDRFVSSQPKTEMIKYISELLKVNRQSWGV